MGRPADLETRAPNRREFFRRSSGAALLAAAPLLPAQAQGAVFQHGVASGDPLSDRVMLWTRVTPPAGTSSVTVDLVVASDPGFTQVVGSGRVRTSAARDFTVKFDAGGLAPGRSWYYRFSALGAASPAGRTRTLPSGATSHLRIGPGDVDDTAIAASGYASFNPRTGVVISSASPIGFV